MSDKPSDPSAPAAPLVSRALSRRDLEAGRMRAIYLESVGGHALTDEQLSASLTETLASKPSGSGWWVFGYGSLMWNPIFPIAESRPARLHGLHRRFCLWSRASRGTATSPGLVLGLVPGGACHGVAYRLPAPLAIDELHLLWRREMVVGSYRPRWVKLDAGGKSIIGLTFVVRRNHPQYAGALSLEEQALAIGRACGHLGTCQDYLERTRVALVSHGIVDPYLERLAATVAGHCEPPGVELP